MAPFTGDSSSPEAVYRRKLRARKRAERTASRTSTDMDTDGTDMDVPSNARAPAREDYRPDVRNIAAPPPSFAEPKAESETPPRPPKRKLRGMVGLFPIWGSE